MKSLAHKKLLSAEKEMQKKNSFFSKNNFWILGEKLLEYITLLNYVTNSS